MQMKIIFNKVTLIPFLCPFISFAQSPLQEIPIQTQPLQGTGVQRVGSAPIPVPIQNVELMASPSITIQRPQGIAIQPIPMAPKKLPYDTTYMTGRIIFLNGVNISSVKNQELENVNLHIDSNGNIYIDAPHYEIGVEQSYHPLMPNELPKFPKAEFREAPIPKGIYSKETGKLTTKESMPVLPKEFAPEVPVKDQSPFQSKAPPPSNENNSQVDSQANDSSQAQGAQNMDKQEEPKK
jgi:hypothetical protein